MDQTFIRVKNEGGDFYDKDIRYTTHTERIIYYNTLSKGQLSCLLEKLGGFNK